MTRDPLGRDGLQAAQRVLQRTRRGATVGRANDCLESLGGLLDAARVFGRETDVGVGGLLELATVECGGACLGPEAGIGIAAEHRRVEGECFRVARLTVRLIAESLTISGTTAGDHGERDGGPSPHEPVRPSMARYASTLAFSGRRARHAFHTSRAPTPSPER